MEIVRDVVEGYQWGTCKQKGRREKEKDKDKEKEKEKERR